MKKTPLKKKSKSPLKSLKRKLWKLISEYVRRKDADKNGMVKCFTCGTKAHWKKMDAGHGIPKSRGQIAYFDLDNIRVQCTSCNLHKHGNSFAFAVNLDKENGQGFSATVLQRTKQIKKYTSEEITTMIGEIKGKLEELK